MIQAEEERERQASGFKDLGGNSNPWFIDRRPRADSLEHVIRLQQEEERERAEAAEAVAAVEAAKRAEKERAKERNARHRRNNNSNNKGGSKR